MTILPELRFVSISQVSVYDCRVGPTREKHMKYRREIGLTHCYTVAHFHQSHVDTEGRQEEFDTLAASHRVEIG